SVILTGWMYNRFYTITVTLPTFPTRRSSDLHRGEASEHGRLLAYFREDPGASVLSDVVGDREGAIRSRALGVHTTLRDDLAIKVDRKSTRLNSSHVKISYAVFCSKKKYIICY